MNKKACSAIVISGIILVGCVGIGSPVAYYKPNISQKQMNSDYDQCQIEGLQKVPTDRVTEAQYDANFDLRQNVVGSCMAAKGYQEVTLPACGLGVSPPDLSQPATITRGTCIYGGGRYYAFVNQ